MLSVHLADLRFWGHHGVYEGETIAGVEYEVQLTVQYDEQGRSFDSLDKVLNYEALFRVVKQRMAIPTPLLEEVADSIVRKIRHEYSFVKEITVSIFKLQPPIARFQGKVGVTLHQKFDD